MYKSANSPSHNELFLFRTVLVLLFCLFGMMNSVAQVRYYGMNKSSNAYSALASPTLLGTAGWDDEVHSLVLPFTLTFNNIAYSSVWVSSNGFVTVGSAPAANNFQPLASAQTYPGCIAGFATDLINNGTSIKYQVLGTAPTRELVIEWQNARRKINGSPVVGDVFNFQIRLREAGSVSVSYGAASISSVTTTTIQAGLRGTAVDDYHMLQGQWSDISGIANNVPSGAQNGVIISDINVPISGRQYTWVPASPINGPSGFCANTYASFSVNPVEGATSYEWDILYGDLAVTSGQGTTSMQMFYPDIDAYDQMFFIKVVASNGATSLKRVTGYAIPGLTLQKDPQTAVCPGSLVILNAYNFNNYQWSPATGLNTTTGSQVLATPQVTTTYTVTGTNSRGCVRTEQITVEVKQPDIQIVATQNPICPGGSTELSVISNGVSYTWGFHPTLSFSGVTRTATPTATTTYSISGTYLGCAFTRSITIEVSPSAVPQVSQSGPLTLCPGTNVVLTAEPMTYESQVMQFNGSNAANIKRNIGDDFTIEYWIRTTQSGVFNQTQWHAGYGIADAEVAGTVNDFGTSILGDRICFGVGGGTSSTDVTIKSTTPINSGQWTHVAMTRNKATGLLQLFINGVLESSATSVNTSTLNSAGLIRIGSGSVAGGFFIGELDELRIWNVVRTPSQIAAGMDKSFGGGQQNLIDYFKFENNMINTANASNTAAFSEPSYNTRSRTVDYGSYLWSNGATTRSITVSSAGNYSVQVPNRFGCQVASAVKAVSMAPNPVITAADVVSCGGQAVAITASGAGEYSWSPSDGLSSTTGATVMAQPSTTTTYTVTGTTNGCSSSKTVTVTVVPPLSGIAGPDQTVCYGTTASDISLANNGTAVSKWQRAAEPTFSNPTDIANNSSLLTAAEIGAITATTYVRAVLTSDTPCLITSDYATISTAQTTWNGSQWSHGQPDSTVAAIIAGPYSSAGDLHACSLTITAGAEVVVNTGDLFDISGKVSVESGTLTFEHDASLLQGTMDVVSINTGSVVSKRGVEMRRLDYAFWGSPVADQNLRDFSPWTVQPNSPYPGAVGSSRFYELSESANQFVAVDPTITDFAPGKGFMIRAPNNFPTNGTTAVFYGTFEGVPNNGTYHVPLTNSGVNLGFNLIANPYPSAIDASAFLSYPGNAGTIYLWTHFNQTSGGGANYCTINLTGPAAAQTGIVSNGILPVGQGFLLQKASSGQATFTNTMRTPASANQMWRNANQEDRHRIWLNLFDHEAVLMNQTLLGYVSSATDSFDEGYDGMLNHAGSSISSLLDGQNLVIQAKALPFDDSDEVALNFVAANAGNYSLAIDHLDGLFEDGQEIFLKDLHLNVVHDLTDSPYIFSSEAGSFSERFVLKFQNSTLGNDSPVLQAASVVLYVKDGVIHLHSGNINMQTVKVFDARGRLLYREEDVNSREISLHSLVAEQQLLLVQVMTADNHIFIKKVMR